MSPDILILRPEPGATETMARAEALGLKAVRAPLFEVQPLAWALPADFELDSILLTSANAARHGGEQLRSLRTTPCFAVGPATAVAAGEFGFADVRLGTADGAAALTMLAGQGFRRTLNLCGREHLPLAHPGVEIVRRLVYASEAAAILPAEAASALTSDALALLHSPRAAATFAELVDAAGLHRKRIALTAISAAAARAAGEGWLSKHAAKAPRDEALLELAVKLCKNRAERQG